MHDINWFTILQFGLVSGGIMLVLLGPVFVSMRAHNATKRLNLVVVKHPVKSGSESISVLEDAVVVTPSSRERKPDTRAGELKKTARIVFVQTCVASRKILSALDEQGTSNGQPDVA
jgi:hypothetical protein